MAVRRLDQIDRRILQELQADARLSNVVLARRVGLSPAPCLRRVRALEDAGIIRSYATLVEPSAIDLGVTVFVQVRLDHTVANRFENFERAIVQRPDVLECHQLMGTTDYLLRVVSRDVDAYQSFLRDFLTAIDGVSTVVSSFPLKQVKYSTALPIIENGGTSTAKSKKSVAAREPTSQRHRQNPSRRLARRISR
jgi:Lrp/AsnC family transcriptional regulator, leucine-responsive regulatory protein